MTTVKIKIESLSCPSCISKIEKVIKKVDGVKKARINFYSSKLKTTFDETQVTEMEIIDTIEKLGYPVTE